MLCDMIKFLWNIPVRLLDVDLKNDNKREKIIYFQWEAKLFY
jgi:hypothetical protein